MLQTLPARAGHCKAPMVGVVGVAVAERLARLGVSGVEALLDRERDHVGRIQPVHGVVEREGGDPAHVGMHGERTPSGTPAATPTIPLFPGPLPISSMSQASSLSAIEKVSPEEPLAVLASRAH